MTVPPPLPAPTGSWAARARWLLTGVLVASSFLASSVSVAYAAEAPDVGALGTTLALVGWCYAVGVATFVVFRKRYPVALTLVSCAGAVVFPLDMFAALVGLAHVIATKDRRTARYLSALTVAAGAISLGRDWLRPAGSQIVGDFGGADVPSAVPLWVYALVLIVSVGASVGVGFVLRARSEVATVTTQVVRQTKAADDLRARVARQDERELIAREVHDVLAHRLSLVSLHSGALEVAVPSDQPQLQDAARVVRENAHASLVDLRDLVALLRDPSGLSESSTGPGSTAPTDLASIQELVDATRSSGVPLVATVVLEDAARASPQLGRSAFRIVQESLTNARKHAPAGRVDLDVRASAERGVRIVVRNALGTATIPAPGSRKGLVGLVERATQMGGRASAGPDGDTFVVDAWLPWSTRD